MAVVTIAETPVCAYNISVSEQLAHESVERPHLGKCLARYGIVDDKLDDVMRQLARNGKTSVEISFGKFEQI